MIPTSIDGTDITGATIDGQDVQEITVDGQTVFSAVDVPDDTIGYWPGDEGSGSTLTDNVGSANLTISGPSWVNESVFTGGKALVFDRTANNHVVSGQTIQPNEFSWFIRVKADDLGGGTPTFRTIICHGKHHPYLLYAVSGEFRFGGSDAFGPGDGAIVSDPLADVEGDVRICVARQSATTSFLDIFDGSKNLIGSDSKAQGVNYESNTTRIGNDLDNRGWDGLIDPNWIQIDKKVSDTEMNDIINDYF